MRWFWPFGGSEGEPSGSRRQKDQLAQSVQRISDDARRKVDQAQRELTEAAEGVKAAISNRTDQSSHLREALEALIDRRSGGRFDLGHERVDRT